MALGTFRHPDIDRLPIYAGPHGNLSRISKEVTVPATAVNGNTIDFFVMKPGMQLVDAFLNVQAAPGTNVTLALGLAQIPGRSDAKVDPDALIAATAAAAAVFLRRNKTGIAMAALLLDDFYLVQATIGGADVADVAVPIECTVIYENVGTP